MSVTEEDCPETDLVSVNEEEGLENVELLLVVTVRDCLVADRLDSGLGETDDVTVDEAKQSSWILATLSGP